MTIRRLKAPVTWDCFGGIPGAGAFVVLFTVRDLGFLPPRTGQRIPGQHQVDFARARAHGRGMMSGFKIKDYPPDGERFHRNAFDEQIGKRIPFTDEVGRSTMATVVAANVAADGSSVELTLDVE